MLQALLSTKRRSSKASGLEYILSLHLNLYITPNKKPHYDRPFTATFSTWNSLWWQDKLQIQDHGPSKQILAWASNLSPGIIVRRDSYSSEKPVAHKELLTQFKLPCLGSFSNRQVEHIPDSQLGFATTVAASCGCICILHDDNTEIAYFPSRTFVLGERSVKHNIM